MFAAHQVGRLFSKVSGTPGTRTGTEHGRPPPAHTRAKKCGELVGLAVAWDKQGALHAHTLRTHPLPSDGTDEGCWGAGGLTALAPGSSNCPRKTPLYGEELGLPAGRQLVSQGAIGWAWDHYKCIQHGPQQRHHVGCLAPICTPPDPPPARRTRVRPRHHHHHHPSNCIKAHMHAEGHSWMGKIYTHPGLGHLPQGAAPPNPTPPHFSPQKVRQEQAPKQPERDPIALSQSTTSTPAFP